MLLTRGYVEYLRAIKYQQHTLSHSRINTIACIKPFFIVPIEVPQITPLLTSYALAKQGLRYHRLSTGPDHRGDFSQLD